MSQKNMNSLNSRRISKSPGTELSSLYKPSEEINPEVIRTRRSTRPRQRPGLFFVQGEPFWRTAEDEQREIHLINMESRHLMNCVRLLYNGIAVKYGFPTVQIVNIARSNSPYSDEIILRTLVVLIEELSKREEMTGDRDLQMIVNVIKAIADRQSFNVKGHIGESHKAGTDYQEPEYEGYDLERKCYVSDLRRLSSRSNSRT